MFGLSASVFIVPAGVAFLALAGWGGYKHIQASNAIGERNVAIEQKNVALAEKQVAIDDRNRAVDANKKLIADMTYLQEQRRREGVLITQLINENAQISKEADDLAATIAETGKTDAPSGDFVRTRIPDALWMHLNPGKARPQP